MSFGQCTNDLILPIAQCKSQLTVALNNTGLASITPNDIDSLSIDNCGIETYLINHLTVYTFDCSDIGPTNPVILTVIDSAGNSGNCISNIEVLDTTAPSIQCPAGPINFCLNTNNSVTITPTEIATGADNCSIVAWKINGDVDLTFDSSQANTTVSITAEDQHMNTAQCSAIINILDTLSPPVLNNGTGTKIAGNIYTDFNLDCTYNIGERGLGGIIIEAVGNKTFYGTTNSSGYYQMTVPPGIYNVRPILPSPYWNLCGSPQTVSSSNHTIVNFGLQQSIDCPLLEVDIAAPYLNQDNTASSYTVSYCNKGTVPAINATIVVEIDPSLSIQSSNLPIINQVGNTCTFLLDTVPANDCGSFSIEVLVSNTAISGQTHCSEVTAYPNNICRPNYWNGAVLESTAACVGDSVLFTIKNKGAGIYAAQSYTIFEDHIVMSIDNTPNINPGDSIIIGIYADAGRTYRIALNQETGLPALLGAPVATAAIEGCQPYNDGSFNLGLITQFSNGKSTPYTATDCQQNSKSITNKISAQPAGYQMEHYIDQNAILDYKIKFQNVSSSIVSTVIIRDTLSEFLNPSTLVMGASSHPYTWRLYDQNILEITYTNIALPDSGTNKFASHGFIRYKIEQKAQNPVGVIIYNHAGIYFDANPAIITNQTWHTVGENFITIKVGKSNDNAIKVSVAPNPFSYETTFEIEGEAYNTLQLKVYDLTGRVITQQQIQEDTKINLSRQNIASGIYLYELIGNNEQINRGRIIIQ